MAGRWRLAAPAEQHHRPLHPVLIIRLIPSILFFIDISNLKFLHPRRLSPSLDLSIDRLCFLCAHFRLDSQVPGQTVASVVLTLRHSR